MKPKHRVLRDGSNSLKLKIRDIELEAVQKAKYLDVQIDNSLDWNEHMKTVSSKFPTAIGVLLHRYVEPHFCCCFSV